MIEQYVVPQLQQDGISDTIICQQMAVYCIIIVREQLNNIFNDRWCGHDEPIPDITPPDFYFVWGYIKSTVYAQRPHNLADLQREIAAAFQQITPEMLHAMWHNVESRICAACTMVGMLSANVL